MKKRWLMLVFMLFVPLILGVEISLSKEGYYPMETLQAEITGNFVSLEGEDILIYKEGIPRSMPVISDLIRKDEVYYFYAVLPNQQGNYSLRIEGSEYFEEGKLKSEVVTKNFIVEKVSTNETILSVNPGFIRTSEDFSIKVKSLNKNTEVSAELKGINETKVRMLSLIKYVEKKLDFSIEGVEKESEIVIGDYKIPVFISKDKIFFERGDLVFVPAILEGSVIAGKDYVFSVIIENAGERDLSVEFSVENGKVEPSAVNLSIRGRAYLNISISVPKKAENNYSVDVIANYGDNKAKIPIRFKVTERGINLSGTSFSESLNCSEQRGFICSYDEECIGDISPSLEGNCCKGECVEIKEFNYGFYIGIFLLILVISVAGYFVWRAKKKGRLKNPQEILKERVERGEERMEGRASEVSGSLGKV